MSLRFSASLLFCSGSLLSVIAGAEEGSVKFNRDVRPILSEYCYACHGPDAKARKADLRLDLESGALADLGGYKAIEPGHPGKSELVARIETDDPDDVMPPPKTGKQLSEEEKSILKRWIASGAEWEGHWAYIPVEKPEVPAVKSASGEELSEVDAFLSRMWEKEGLEPTHLADPERLIRRLSLDLTGLPPDPADVRKFVNDPSEKQYRALVDQYLNSPAFGERMAVFWLDLVRYADTVGYHGDQPYSVFPFRDYVIDSFNQNKPFDQFTREQIAGDLLPDATLMQRVASGYNRLHMMTAEGGAQDKEYLAKYAADRIRTTGSAWLGSTMGCAECHDHKYDPITTRDFYSMQAFFADLDEKGFYGGADWGPKIPVPEPAQQEKLEVISGQISSLENQLNAVGDTEVSAAQARWEKEIAQTSEPALGSWHVAGPFQGRDFNDAYDRSFIEENRIVGAESLNQSEAKVGFQVRSEFQDGVVHELNGDNSATYLARVIDAPAEMVYPISIGSDDSIRIWLNGESVFDLKTSRGVAPDQNQVDLKLTAGINVLLMKVVNGTGGYAFYFKGSGAVPENIVRIAREASCDRSPEDQLELTRYYRSVSSEWKSVREQVESLKAEKQMMESSIPTMLVSVSREPRTIRILPRGNWLDETGPIVQPSVPEFLGALQLKDGQRASRLDLANWLASRDNPLTARTFVNRLWNLYFGQGLSRILDDLGSQGAPPTHPELLDWLAAEFMDSGWDVKHIIREIVGSKAYQLDSTPTAEQLKKDPQNIWLARQNRFRLPAEFVRDNVLKISGLLTKKIGGPSARPYQPAGYYSQLNFPKREYQADSGEDQYRRGVYTHWQRTFTHPSMTAFDAPSREECVARRPVSNTPLQALTLLNDPSYVEAARVFAQRLLKTDSPDDTSRLNRAFMLALSRNPEPMESEALVALLERHRKDYQEDLESAKALVQTGLAPVDAEIPVTELAAWTSVTQTIFNLNETITRY